MSHKIAQLNEGSYQKGDQGIWLETETEFGISNSDLVAAAEPIGGMYPDAANIYLRGR